MGLHYGGKWLDHVVLWQRFHERELYGRGVKPSLTRGRFRANPQEFWNYSASRGPGPEPNQSKLQDRERKLRRWEQDVRRVKDEARAWAERQ